MIGTETLEQLLKLIPYTGRIYDAEPVSTLLIAPPEHGKTELIKKVKTAPNTVYLTDFTPFGLDEVVSDQIIENGVTHLLCPDMIRVFARRVTREALVTYLNGLTEEGIELQLTYATLVKSQRKRNVGERYKAGIVIAITTAKNNQYYKLLSETGFYSRMLKIRYKYSDETKQRIINSIVEKEKPREEPFTFNIPTDKVKVCIKPKQIAQLIPLFEEVNSDYAGVGARLLKHLIALTQAAALEAGRKKVTQADIELILSFREYLTFRGAEI